jgi:hypothetical protein
MDKYWLNPPTITELDAGEGLPPWILLDTRIYFRPPQQLHHGQGTTRKGQGIEVTVCGAAPPALCFVSIHMPGAIVPLHRVFSFFSFSNTLLSLRFDNRSPTKLSLLLLFFKIS